MANLKCHAYFCAYNNCTHCSFDNPKVSSQAECESFVKQVRAIRGNPYLFEYAEDRRFSLRDDEHYIPCDANSCLNNSCDSCAAHNIRIDISKNEPKCMNYRKKVN